MALTKDIRNGAYNLLKEAKLVSNIANSKVTPQWLENTPAILVYADTVQGDQLSANRAAFINDVALQIDIIVAMTDNWADAADDLVTAVLDTLMTNDEWLSSFTHISSTKVTYSFIGDMQKPLGTAQIAIIGQTFKAY